MDTHWKEYSLILFILPTPNPQPIEEYANIVQKWLNLIKIKFPLLNGTLLSPLIHEMILWLLLRLPQPTALGHDVKCFPLRNSWVTEVVLFGQLPGGNLLQNALDALDFAAAGSSRPVDNLQSFPQVVWDNCIG